MKPIEYEACIYDHCTYALTQQNQAKVMCVCVCVCDMAQSSHCDVRTIDNI